MLTQFATAKAGLILVNINPAYRPHELEYALNKVGCNALILAASYKSATTSAWCGRWRRNWTAANRVSWMLHKAASAAHRDPPGHGQTSGHAELRRYSRIWPRRTSTSPRSSGWRTILQFDDAINIQFTSGTTGNPKGATLTHHNILNNGFFIGEAMRLTEQDRLCIPVPFYHCFGMVLGNLACVTHRACMVIPGEGFDPLAVLTAVQEERCTGLHGVPTMFIAVLDHPDFQAIRSHQSAHRHHGGIALSDRGHEAGCRPRCTCARSPSPMA